MMMMRNPQSEITQRLSIFLIRLADSCRDIRVKMEKKGRAPPATSMTKKPQSTVGKKRKQFHEDIELLEGSQDGADAEDDDIMRGILPPSTRKKQNIRGPPPAFKPLPKTSLPSPNWTQAKTKSQASSSSSSFSLPTPNHRANNLESHYTSTKTAHTSDKGPPPSAYGREATHPDGEDAASVPSDSANGTTPQRPQATYAETNEFEFKFIVSYFNDPETEINFHHSTDLADKMTAFWSYLDRLVLEWEDAAGTDWAWDLQKAANRRKRYCVSSKLAQKRTIWRAGDSSYFACKACARGVKPCFTWVEGDDDGKGKFWCLPVHPDDRRCEVKKDKEIRTWINEAEGEESESESGSESDGERDWDGGYHGRYDYGLGSDGAESESDGAQSGSEDDQGSMFEASELDSGEEEDL